MRIQLVVLVMLATLVARGNDRQRDQVIARHIEACGGKENWEKIHAVELKGYFTGFSVEEKLYVLKTKEGKFYSDYHLGKNRIIEGFNGIEGWTIDPWQEMLFARRINRHEQHVFMQKAELFTPFYRWKERGFKVEYRGKETIDGIEMEVLVLTRPGMSPETWYFDASTYLPYKSVAKWVDFTLAVNGETYYDDYRNVQGLLIPHYMEQTYSTRHTTTRIEEVVVNPGVDEQVFNMPACEHMKKLEPVAGTWDVLVDNMTRRGWHTFDTIRATFTRQPENVIHGSVTQEVNFLITNNYTLSYNRQLNKYELVVYEDLYSSTNLYQGTFADNALVFESGSVKFVLTFNGEEGFIMERQGSSDNGQTWQAMERLRFSNH